MMAFLLLVLTFIDQESKEVDAIVSIASPLFVGAVLVLFLMAANPNLMRRLVQLVLGWAEITNAQKLEQRLKA